MQLGERVGRIQQLRAAQSVPFLKQFSFLAFLTMSTSRQQPGHHQGHIARKRFGQNFLVDMGVIDSIVDVIRPQRGERMVESARDSAG